MASPNDDGDAAPAYTMNRLNILQHFVEVTKAEKMTTKECKARIPSIAKALTTSETFITNLKECDFAVVERTVPPDFDFTFDKVHHHGSLPLPNDVETTPVVAEIVFQEGNDSKIFVRIKIDLIHYDGVTGLHSAFASLEYMEHGDISKVTPYPFEGNNGDVPESNFGNFFKRVGKALYGATGSLFYRKYWQGKFLHGPFQSNIEEAVIAEEGRRKCYRYNSVPSTMDYKGFTEIMDTARVALNLDNFATTVNYSPKVCVAILPSRELIHNKEERLKYIALPPSGAGPPPPMDASHPALLYDCVFFNNYGRHKTNFSGEVSDLLWDWQGMFTTFCFFMWVCSVDGKMFVRACGPPQDMEMLKANGCLEAFGKQTEFEQTPFYSSLSS